MKPLRPDSGGAVWGIVVAAGAGTRFGGAKQWADLGGRTLTELSVAACTTVCDGVILVVPGGLSDPVPHTGAHVVVSGGSTRTASVRNGLAAVPVEASVIVVHDAVRPAASADLFGAVVAQVRNGAAAAVPGLAVTDTLKRVDNGEISQTLDREAVVTVQTPQAFDAAWLRRAHADAGEATDDAALVERAGGRVVVVEGEPDNVKVTTPADLDRLTRIDRRMPSLRVGHGFDVHRWASAPRPLVLGGVTLPGDRGLEGHSDADVVSHALADAVLGAAGLGDLGAHFPDSDSRWVGARSTELLTHVVDLAAAVGLVPVNADVTVLAEAPRLSTHIAGMTSALGEALGAPVSVKATTAEGLGALGRAEGIAAWAVTLLAGA